MEIRNTVKKMNFSDLEIETLTSLINEINYRSQNHPSIISSNALRKSEVNKINYMSQNHTADSRSALDERHFEDGIIHVRFHDTKA